MTATLMHADPLHLESATCSMTVQLVLDVTHDPDHDHALDIHVDGQVYRPEQIRARWERGVGSGWVLHEVQVASRSRTHHAGDELSPARTRLSDYRSSAYPTWRLMAQESMSTLQHMPAWLAAALDAHTPDHDPRPKPLPIGR